MTHKPESALITSIEYYAQLIPVGSTFFHYKDPTKTYTVRSLVIIEADDSVGVVYQANYGQCITFVRPAEEWLEQIQVDGATVQRFQRINV